MWTKLSFIIITYNVLLHNLKYSLFILFIFIHNLFIILFNFIIYFNNYNYNFSFRSSIRKSKCISPIISSVSNINYKSSIVEQPQFTTKAPKNAAIHFGNFYGLWNDVEKVYSNNQWNNYFTKEKTTMTKGPHRLEFTRQMVHR